MYHRQVWADHGSCAFGGDLLHPAPELSFGEKENVSPPAPPLGLDKCGIGPSHPPLRGHKPTYSALDLPGVEKLGLRHLLEPDHVIPDCLLARLVPVYGLDRHPQRRLDLCGEKIGQTFGGFVANGSFPHAKTLAVAQHALLVVASDPQVAFSCGCSSGRGAYGALFGVLPEVRHLVQSLEN